MPPHVQLTVTGANCGLETIGAVRVVLEPKPGLPTDPNNPRAFNDVLTDISPLFVINNESGWYEGWIDRGNGFNNSSKIAARYGSFGSAPRRPWQLRPAA